MITWEPYEPICLSDEFNLTSLKFKGQHTIYENLIIEALKRSKTQEAKAFRRLRNIQAEGTFANLKEVLKFKKVYSLGLQNAAKRFIMGCAVINLKKLLRFWRDLFQFLKETFCFLKQTVTNSVYFSF